MSEVKAVRHKGDLYVYASSLDDRIFDALHDVWWTAREHTHDAETAYRGIVDLLTSFLVCDVTEGGEDHE